MTTGRSAGILLSISSLPGKYGIGTLGKTAYEYADFLKAAGQKIWQILPLGPTGCGDSPYQSFSSFAGNPYFIDLEMLMEDGLLTPDEVESKDWGNDPEHIDYGKLYENRFICLSLAKKRGWDRDAEKVSGFVQDNASWLDAYAKFMALKRANGMKPWTAWERPDFDESMEEDRQLFIYIQYLFYQQWKQLKTYINSLGIRLVGDLPIYVSPDSADVWAEPEQFRLNSDNLPVEVSGVPPDYFNEDGQLWGNPLYDYEHMKKDGYSWWIRRVGGVSRLYDIIRIDHFRGFASYWAVPYGADNARVGRWVKGPGIDLVRVLTSWFHDVEFIAEDLGVLTGDVYELLEESGLPGMKVLEFAFSPDTKELSSHLPVYHKENSLCYTATHDNAPIVQWVQEEDSEVIAFAEEYLGVSRPVSRNTAGYEERSGTGGAADAGADDVAMADVGIADVGMAGGDDAGTADGDADDAGEAGGDADNAGAGNSRNRGDALREAMLRAGMQSVAKIFIAPMQDWLGLGAGSRMNTPGVAWGNWTWRMRDDVDYTGLAEKIRRMTAISGRLSENNIRTTE